MGGETKNFQTKKPPTSRAVRTKIVLRIFYWLDFKKQAKTSQNKSHIFQLRATNFPTEANSHILGAPLSHRYTPVCDISFSSDRLKLFGPKYRITKFYGYLLMQISVLNNCTLFTHNSRVSKVGQDDQQCNLLQHNSIFRIDGATG